MILMILATNKAILWRDGIAPGDSPYLVQVKDKLNFTQFLFMFAEL